MHDIGAYLVHMVSPNFLDIKSIINLIFVQLHCNLVTMEGHSKDNIEIPTSIPFSTEQTTNDCRLLKKPKEWTKDWPLNV
jgi:hypothetical protein